jgi:uncharacterized protein Veg
MNFQDEIRQKNLERVNSIYYQFIEDDLKKSLSTSTTFGESKDILGKDIIKSLNSELENKEIDLNVEKNKIQKSINGIGILPNCYPENYISENWKGQIDVPFNMYSYSQIYSEGNDKANMMKSFNDSLKSFISDTINNKKLEIVISHIPEDKNYNLPMGLVKKLNL